jgi:hypothetical protein
LDQLDIAGWQKNEIDLNIKKSELNQEFKKSSRGILVRAKKDPPLDTRRGKYNQALRELKQALINIKIAF